MRIASDLTQVVQPTWIALGNFDGVHRGHRRVIQPAVDASVQARDQARDQANEPQALSTVVTFFPHPREYFSGERRSLLTPPAEKVQQLQRMGVEQLVLLPFGAALATLSPQVFVEEILLRGLDCRSVSVGADFHFAVGRSGNAQVLEQLLAPHGVALNLVPLVEEGGDRISSSRIRAALSSGHLEAVIPLLGRRYALQGKVVRGRQLGRTIGFPTANLQLPERKFIPRLGVYGVLVSTLQDLDPLPSADRLDPADPADPAVPWLDSGPDAPVLSPAPLRQVPGVMNLGLRPTVAGEGVTAEVHLLDWQGDLYGQELRVELVQYLRPECKFNGLAELQAQIALDTAQARQILGAMEGAGA